MQRKAFPVIDARATGRNIVRLRMAQGLSVRDIQRYFGFDEPQAIYKWQSGKSLPTLDNLYALSTLLNVTMEEILVRSSYQLNTTSFEQQAEPGCSIEFYRLVWKDRCNAFTPIPFGHPVRLGCLNG